MRLKQLLMAAALLLVFSVASFAQSTTRTVTGTVKKPDGTAWVGASVKFVLTKGSYSTTTQFPVTTITKTTDSQGQFTATLWVTSEALKFTRYECTLPDGDTFKFDLTAGSSIDLATLRAASGTAPTPPDPAYALLESLITTHEAAANPHPGYLTQAEGDLLYEPLGGGGASALDDLTDVMVTSPAASHALVFNGTLWANRPLVKGDVGLGSVDNTSDAAKPVSTATQAALDAKQSTSEKNGANGYAGLDASGLMPDNRLPSSIARDSEVTSAVVAEAAARASADAALQPLDADLTTFASLTPSANDVLQFVSGAWANRTAAQLKTSLSLTATDVGLGSVTNDAQLKIASNLSDLNNSATARTNLGLGAANSPSLAGLTLSGLTAGRIPFAGTGGLLSDDSTLLWDNTNKRLGVGMTPGAYRVDVSGTLRATNLYATGDVFAVRIMDIGAGLVKIQSNLATGDMFTVDFAGSTIKLGVQKDASYFTTPLGVNKSSALGAQLHVVAGAAGTPTAIFQLAASPTADAVKVRSSANADLYRITKDGEPYPVTQGNGVILRDTDGAGCHRLTVNTAGTITATAITCP